MWKRGQSNISENSVGLGLSFKKESYDPIITRKEKGILGKQNTQTNLDTFKMNLQPAYLKQLLLIYTEKLSMF